MKKTSGSLISLLVFLSYYSNASTFLLADAYLDVVNGKIIKPAVIEIEDELIKSINTVEADAITSGHEKIYLNGITLMPGLIDMHTHLTGEHDVHGLEKLQTTDGRAAINGVKNAKITLMTGITTVRNLGAPGYVDVDLRNAINDGDVIGPRMFVSGPSLGITGGHCDNNLLPQKYATRGDGVADGPWELRKRVRENIKYGADVIKFCATGGVMSRGDEVDAQQFTLEEMQALIDEAHLAGLKVAAHAHGTNGIRTAIMAGVDSVEHASFLDRETIKLAKQQGTYLTMDIYVTEFILSEGEEAGISQESLDKEKQVGERQRQSFTNAVKAGLPMVFGTDAAVYPHGQNTRQLSRMVKFGMTATQALQAATINAATLLGQADKLGSIESNKYADIIGLKGNPLENIRLLESVDFIMKNGMVYKP